MDILQKKVRQLIASAGMKPPDFKDVFGLKSRLVAGVKFQHGIKSIKDLSSICKAAGAKFFIKTKSGDIIDFTDLKDEE